MKWTEITGAELNKPFKVAGFDGEFAIIEYYDNRSQLIEVVSRVPSCDILDGCSLTPNEFFAIIHAAPAGIIHLPPPLTDEQREQLKALYTLGYRWLSKDSDGSVYASKTKPYKVDYADHWVGKYGMSYLCCSEFSVCLESLVSWSDPEPFDIAKALGVEE